MNEIELLNLMRQNLEMGIDGIQMVLPYAKNEGLKQALNRQLDEYRDYYDESDDLLSKHNGKPKDIPVMAKISSEVMGTVKAMTNHSDSKIAEDMVRGTTTGIAKLIRHQGEYRGGDREVNDLCTRLIETEEKNCEEMKQYL